LAGSRENIRIGSTEIRKEVETAIIVAGKPKTNRESNFKSDDGSIVCPAQHTSLLAQGDEKWMRKPHSRRN